MKAIVSDGCEAGMGHRQLTLTIGGDRFLVDYPEGKRSDVRSAIDGMFRRQDIGSLYEIEGVQVRPLAQECLDWCI